MAVIALTSASGSPGVTTTAVALAFLWPRPVVLVEADPTGGSAILAGYFRGTREYDVGIVELALSALPPSDALREAIGLIPDTHVSLLAGTERVGAGVGSCTEGTPCARGSARRVSS